MQIIPVIDLKTGQAVYARHGERGQYRPIRSALCQDSSPASVLQGYLSVYPFTIVYIADLDAITGQGNNRDTIQAILAAYPEITFWVDRGQEYADPSFDDKTNYLNIIGSESMTRHSLQWLSEQQNTNFVLSLDFTASGAQGPSDLFKDRIYWPKTVIIMTLAYVGANAGPDFKRLSYYKKHYPEIDFVAAGGIRNSQDLERLQECGISHALVASALHAQTLEREEIGLHTARRFPDNAQTDRQKNTP